MNAIVANKYQQDLDSLGFDVIKSIYGEFDVDYIISTFKDFYFKKMFLDITAIKDNQNIKNLQKLVISLDMNKVILFLGEDGFNSPSFYSNLISLGIYNFTRNVEGARYLYDNPNSYRNVQMFHVKTNQNDLSFDMKEENDSNSIYDIKPEQNVPREVYGIPRPRNNTYDVKPEDNLPECVYAPPKFRENKYDMEPEKNIPEKVYGIPAPDGYDIPPFNLNNQDDKKDKEKVDVQELIKRIDNTIDTLEEENKNDQTLNNISSPSIESELEQFRIDEE